MIEDIDINNIDIERLRSDLINYFEGAYFVGGFGAATFDIDAIDNATNEQLLVIADELDVNIGEYEKWERG